MRATTEPEGAVMVATAVSRVASFCDKNDHFRKLRKRVKTTIVRPHKNYYWLGESGEMEYVGCKTIAPRRVI